GWRAGRRRLGCGLGSANACRFAGLDGGVSDSAVAAALPTRGDEHIRLWHLARHRSARRGTRELAAVFSVASWLHLAARRSAGPGWPRGADAPRADAVRPHQE